MTAIPQWGPKPAPRPRCQRPLCIPQGSARTLNKHPQTLAPSPVRQARGVSAPGSLPALAVQKSGGRPSALPCRSGPAATPESVGSRVCPPLRSSPGKSGWKSHSQKVPKLQRSEVRSQAAAAAETSPSSPRRSEPQGRQPRVSAAIRVRPEPGLGPPTASPENYRSRRASLRGSHRLWPTIPGCPLAPLKGPPRRPAAEPEGGLQGEPANCPIPDGGPRFHNHGN